PQPRVVSSGARATSGHATTRRGRRWTALAWAVAGLTAVIATACLGAVATRGLSPQATIPDNRLGDILRRYGAPSCIDHFHRAGTIILHYPTLHLLASVPNSQWGPRTPVTRVVADGPVPRAYQPSAACVASEWDGTRDVERFTRYRWAG